jgi:hypothetical protein
MSLKREAPAKAATEARGDITTRLPKHTEPTKACKCPRCNYAAPSTLFAPGWLDDLHLKAARHWSLGFGPDLGAMSLIEMHALWRWLLKQGG